MPQLFKFTSSMTPQTSTSLKSFGEKTATTFRLTSSFDIAAKFPAYAMLSGTVLLQQQTADSTKVNLFLKPDDQKDIKLPVKYIIYRGLDINDFLQGTNPTVITDAGTTVKTNGTELLAKMQVIQQNRAPGDAIPVEALFGNELTPLSTKQIDEFFFKNLAPTSQLFPVPGGIELGGFAPGEVGIEILLENPEFFPTVEMAGKAFFEQEANGSTAQEKKWQRDLIRHFADPAAFYGLHFDIAGGIEYRTGATLNAATTIPDIFTNILDLFKTKNTVYLDIRNENGYSYNYYGNYVGSSGADADKELQVKPGASGAFAYKEYYDLDWPVCTVSATPSTTLETNTFFLKLRVNDNERPLVAGRNATISPISVVDQSIIFIDESILLPIPIPDPLPELTLPITVTVPNKLVSGAGEQIATVVRIDYYKQAIPISTSDQFPYTKFTDYLFGPLDITIPFDSGNNVQWITSKNTSYADALSTGYVIGQMNTAITNIQPLLKQIEIFGEIPVNLDKPIEIENTINPQNVGFYTPLSVDTSGGTTKITVSETIPGAMQSGDQLVLAVKINGEMNYSTNAFLIKGADYSGLPALVNGSQLDFYTNYNFANSYIVNNVVFASSDTTVAFTISKSPVGFAGIIETGMILQSDSPTSGGNDNDRIVFYASPKGYFSADGAKHGISFADKGGGSKLTSILATLEAMMPGIVIDRTILNPVVSLNVLTFTYSSKSKAKEMLFLLGLSKVEWQTAKTVAAGALSTLHTQMFRLVPNGGEVRDLNKVAYYNYALHVVGLDSSGLYASADTGIVVYTLDHLIFTTQDFAEQYGIDDSVAAQALDDFLTSRAMSKLVNYTNEEYDNVSVFGRKNYVLLSQDTQIQDLISDLRTALDSVSDDFTAITNLLTLKGAALLTLARARIREVGQPYTNKDGIVYIARLIMQVVIKNHPRILSKFPSRIKEFYTTFEKASKGLDGPAKPDFTSYPNTYKKVLISGFDPFQSGADWTGDLSNPSGNIALALDGVPLMDSTNTQKGIIHSALFPVRWEDFDYGIGGDTSKPVDRNAKGVAEQFFDEYFSGPNKVDMIITFSYGVHYDRSIDHDFHLERFAANWQDYAGDNNGYNSNYDRSLMRSSTTPAIVKPLTTAPQKDWVYIESTLPFRKLEDGSTGKIKVTNYEAVVNHGGRPNNNTLSRWFHWLIKGKPNSGGPEQDITNNWTTPNIPAPLFPTPFQNYGGGIPTLSGVDLSQPFFFRNYLICDSNEIKYFYPTTSNPYYVPLPTWNNYKNPALETTHSNIRIEAQVGSGGAYMSNLIFYRVGFMRKSKSSTIPTGHIHMGFNSVDPHGTDPDNRVKMLEDVLEMIKKFNDIL